MSPPALAAVTYLSAGIVLLPFLAGTSPLVDSWWWEARRDDVHAISVRARRPEWFARSAMAAGLVLGSLLVVGAWPAVVYIRVRDLLGYGAPPDDEGHEP